MAHLLPSEHAPVVKRRPTPRALVGVLIVAAAFALIAFRASHRMPDFEVYWTAGWRAARAQPLYPPTDGIYRFLYFPAFAVLAIPFGAIPLAAAKIAWFGICAASLVALLRLSVLALPERRRPLWWLVLAAVLGLGKYYAEELVLGQVNLLFAVVAMSATVALRAQRAALAGSLVALAVIVKPYGLIFLPWMAARRQLASTLAAVIGLAVAFALVSIVYGVGGAIDLHQAWWTAVTDRTAATLGNSDNVSVASMYAKWLGTGTASEWLSAATSLLLLLSAALVFHARRGVARPEALEAALLLMLTPLLSPQGWDFVLVVCTPAIIHIVNYHDRLPGPLRVLSTIAIAVIGLSLYDLLGRRLLYALLNMAVITPAVMVLVASLCVLRLRRVA